MRIHTPNIREAQSKTTKGGFQMAEEKKEGLFPSGKMNRRDFLKKAGKISVGAALAGTMLGSGARLFAGGEKQTGTMEKAAGPTEKWPIPLNQNRFKGMKMQAITDSGWSSTLEIAKPGIMKECGIGDVTREIANFGEEYAKIVPQLMSAKPRMDFFVYAPMFLGDFVNMGALEPLDKYYEMFEGSAEYLKGVMPAYKNFYTQWSGTNYSVMVDGDILLMHYLKPYFEDPQYKTKFEKRFKMELKPPDTWDDYLKCAQFFTEETPEGVYGSQMLVTPPAYAWGYFFNVAVGNGVKYFDENMNPGITTPEAVEALEMWLEIIKWSPPGGANMGLGETINAWQSRKTVMALWWIDLAEFSAQQVPELADEQSATLVPGWKKNGKVVHRSLLLANRVASIPKNIPEERKLAAAYFIYRLSHKDYSIHYVADEYSGSDPFLEIHYSDQAVEEYLKPDPLRGITPEWPTNGGIFKSRQTAREHLDAGLANVKVGYPQFNWVGGAEYTDALGRAVAKAATGELKPSQALEQAAEEWTQTVQKYGIAEQKAQYAVFVETAKKMGYW